MPSASAASLPTPGKSRRRCGLLIIPSLLFCLIFGFTFAPALREIPDTAKARAGFQELTGHPATEVQEIRFYEQGSFKGDEDFLRFTYPNDSWADRFLRERELQRYPGVQPSYGYEIARWWDGLSQLQLSECYHTTERLNARYMVWVDRPHRQMYICSFSL